MSRLTKFINPKSHCRLGKTKFQDETDTNNGVPTIILALKPFQTTDYSISGGSEGNGQEEGSRRCLRQKESSERG